MPPSAATLHESGRSVILVVNKWDAVTTGRTDGKAPADREIFEKQVRRALKYPRLRACAVSFPRKRAKWGMGRVLKEVKKVAAGKTQARHSHGQMNRFLEKIDFQRAPVPMSKRIRIFYMTQAAVAPPTLLFFYGS